MEFHVMRIAILGAGKVGAALGAKWFRTGHDIVFGVRDPSDAKHRAASDAAGGAVITRVATAAGQAEAVVLAAPWGAVPKMIADCGSLAGKIVIDATNPVILGEDGLQMALGFSTSGAEEIARLAPGAAVFKTLNHVGAAVMADATGYAARPTVFVAGDDATRKVLVSRLVEALGFESIDAGPLRTARLLEPYALLWIDQARNRGARPDNALAVMRRDLASR
jgi:predicted dinucleotide-binding enzyme